MNTATNYFQEKDPNVATVLADWLVKFGSVSSVTREFNRLVKLSHDFPEKIKYFEKYGVFALKSNNFFAKRKFHHCVEKLKVSDAVLHDCTQIFLHLIKNTTLPEKNQLLRMACLIGRVEVVNELVHLGADVNDRNQSGHTSLHLACTQYVSYGHCSEQTVKDERSKTVAVRAELALFLYKNGANSTLLDHNKYKFDHYLSKKQLRSYHAAKNREYLIPFSRDVAKLILRHLPKKDLCKSVMLTCKLFRSVATEILIDCM